jgi:probable F420-dependent oxidoreductase
MSAPDPGGRLALLRGAMGRIGIWSPPPGPAGDKRRAFGAAIGMHGFGSLWIGGGNAAPDAFAQLVPLLEGSSRLVVGTGCAIIWARDPAGMREGADGLAESFPGRFILGLGVSHAPLVEKLGRSYARPLAAMVRYLDELDHPAGHGAQHSGPRVLAALGPKMLELSRDRADGAHPYFVPVEHTAYARQILGTAPLLIPEQAVVLEPDRTAALAAARAYAARYLQMPNYVSNLKRFGFGPDDTDGAGSDRLIDALIPHGPAAVAGRVRQHLAAGADHVLLQPLDARGQFSFGDIGPLAEVLAGI